jgi:hypothetical protein
MWLEEDGLFATLRDERGLQAGHRNRLFFGKRL